MVNYEVAILNASDQMVFEFSRYLNVFSDSDENRVSIQAEKRFRGDFFVCQDDVFELFGDEKLVRLSRFDRSSILSITCKSLLFFAVHII